MASTLPPQSSAGGIFIHGDHRRHHHHDDIRWDGVCPADQKEPDCQWENQHIHSDQVALQKDVYYSQQRCGILEEASLIQPSPQPGMDQQDQSMETRFSMCRFELYRKITENQMQE